MSPIEVRTTREVKSAIGVSKTKIVQPGTTETVSPSYFGLGNGFYGERIHLEMSCDASDTEGEVVVFREKGKPRFKLGLLELGFKVNGVSRVNYKVRKGQGRKYISERGHKLLRVKMK